MLEMVKKDSNNYMRRESFKKKFDRLSNPFDERKKKLDEIYLKSRNVQTSVRHSQLMKMIE